MTRLTQALERADPTRKQRPTDDPAALAAGTRVAVPPTLDFNSGETGKVADAPHRPMRVPAVMTEVTKHEPEATRTTAPIRCPGCERVQGVRSQGPGFWGRRILPLFRIGRYRCDACGHRFYRFNVDTADPVTDQNGVGVFSTFLPPADNRDFNELIRDIAEAERDQQSSPDSSPVDEPPTRESRESLNWPAVSNQKTDPRK